MSDFADKTLPSSPPIEVSQYQRMYFYSQPDVFCISFNVGYNESDINEPETIYINDVDVFAENGKNIATAALSILLQESKSNGVKYVRMGILNPAMIRVAEKLVEGGHAKSSHYDMFFWAMGLSNVKPSLELIEDSDQISASDALNFMNNVIEINKTEELISGLPEDLHASTHCVIVL